MEIFKNILRKYWYYFVILLFLIFIVLFQVWMFFSFNTKINNKNNYLEISTDIEKEKIKSEVSVEEVAVEKLFVDIKGMVKKPGTYQLDMGARVIDAINMAGGLLERADTSVNNLSMKLKDEMVIIIYSNDQVKNFIKVKEEEKVILDGCKNESILDNDSCIEKEEDNSDSCEVLDKKVSINSANLEELMQLPNIGEAKAKSIIEYRNINGNFLKIEDLMNVSGIGEKLFEAIKEYISL